MITFLAQLATALVTGIAVAVAGAYFTHRLIRAREEERWEREDEAQRLRWVREDRIRFQAERLSVYQDFMAGLQRALDTGGHEFDGERLGPLLRKIELVASGEVAEAASDAFTHGSQTWHADQRFRDRRDSGVKLEEAMLRFEDSYSRFKTAARAELGIAEGAGEH